MIPATALQGERPDRAPEQIAAIFSAVRNRVHLAPDAIVVHEGSLAEGFGNAGSDVDFLVLIAGDEETPTMPTVLFEAGRRVEVRTRSEAQLRRQLELAASGEADEDVLNRVQRFLRAQEVARDGRAPDLDRLRALFPYPDFTAHMQRWWRERAEQALLFAVALAALGDDESALGWARDGLDQAAKSWLAGQGEGYIETKWLPKQFDRSADQETQVHYRSARTGSFLDALASAAAFGVDIPADGESLVLRRIPDVTTWPIAGRLHVIRGRADVFVLSDDAAPAWRSVVFGRPLTQLDTRHRPTIARFIQLGLVGLRTGTEPVRPALAMCPVFEGSTPSPTSHRPALGLRGAHASNSEPVSLIALPATRFVRSAIALVWANIVLENAREDLDGAIASGQSAVAGIAADRLVAMGVRAVVSAFGVDPLPADVAAGATVRWMLPAEGWRRDEFLEALATARTDAEHLVRFTEVVRDVVGGSDFPSSFASREEWRRTLDIGYDWLRLGGYLDTSFPLDEARDLLESGGSQPLAAGSA
ncbi:hypothetical protein ACPW96_08705 [Micromonospora sp. DT81.3]|uniref:hypothetical protein n=1 Tax=Actinomycetes TaxID=1760 RepID=UPI003CF6F393